MRVPTTTVTALLGLLLTGCSPDGMRGTVDGAEVPIVDTFFSEHPKAFGNKAGVVFVIGTSLPEGCRQYIAWEDRAKGLSDPDELAAAWAETFPPEFWEAVVVVRVYDPARTIDPMNIQALAWDAAPEELHDSYMRVTHHTGHRTSAWFAGGDDPNAVTYLSHRGFLEVHKHVPGSRIKGRFQASMVRTDTTRVRGALELSFDAGLCPGVLSL